MPSVMRRYAASEPKEGPTAAPVVLMVSGGADSTALLVLAATTRLDIDDGRGLARIAPQRLHVLHVNHQLRGIDAEEDEEFVRELSQRFGIPCTVRSFDVARMAVEAGGDTNVENVGREARYAAAAQLADELSAKAGTQRSAARILTAHTANDRAETFFMNAIRGTGPAGLSSIPRRRSRIVRPLLDRTHEELCEMLRMRGIVWREDASNADTRYLRSYVRHELMPVVERRNPRVTASLSSTCDILADEDAYMNRVAMRTYRGLLRRESEGMVALDAGRLAGADVAIARRVVRHAMLVVCPAARLEARHISAVLSIVAAGTGSTSIPMGCDARVEYGLLFVRRPERSLAARRQLASWLAIPGRLELPDGRVLVGRVVAEPMGQSAPEVARAHALEWDGASVLLDALACGVDPVQGGRLWVDAVAPGDVMCPLGMHGQSKKVYDLLNEATIPAADRSRVPIVRSSVRGRILWVAGVRPDERVRCRPETHQMLELTLLDA